MGCSSGPDVVEDGLVLCLDAGSKRSYPGTGTTWTDTVGGNDGTLTNGPTFSSANGGCIVFDGANDTVVQPVSFGVIDKDTSGITMDIYLRASIVTAGTGYWLFSYSSGGNDGYRMILRSGKLDFTYGGVRNNPLGDILESEVFSGDWVNVVITDDGSSIKGYINGQIKDSVSSPFTPNLVGLDQIEISDQYVFAGDVSTARIYNRALTADEIRRNYLSTKERYQ